MLTRNWSETKLKLRKAAEKAEGVAEEAKEVAELAAKLKKDAGLE